MATKEGKKAPAKKAVKKTAAKKAPAKKAAAAEGTGRRGRRPSYDPDGSFVVVDPDAVKRGKFRELVDAALSVGKKFTLPELQAAGKKIDYEGNQLISTFNFGFRKGVFAQA